MNTMNLTLYFRLIVAAIFQPMTKLKYDKLLFYCPEVYAKDGFHVSLQIHNDSYSSSENGYRELGFTWDTIEFGFTSVHDEIMDQYSETSGDTCTTVGRIPIDIMEQVFERHGGIDWEQTLNIENMHKFTTL